MLFSYKSGLCGGEHPGSSPVSLSCFNVSCLPGGKGAQIDYEGGAETSLGLQANGFGHYGGRYLLDNKE